MTIPPMTIQPPPPQPRRRTNPLTVLVTILIILICLVVAADRIGERIAEDQVGARLQTRLETPEKPKVEVAGVPFLTQVIARRFGEVRLTADQIPVSTRSTAALDRLDLALHDVTVGDQQLTAATVDGTAFVAYPSLSALGGAEVSHVAGGKIMIDFTAPVGGQTVSGTLTGRPVLDAEGQLSLVEPQLRVAGIDLPQTLVDALLTSLLRSFTLPELPFGLAMTSVTATDAGMTFGLAGQDIAVDR